MPQVLFGSEKYTAYMDILKFIKINKFDMICIPPLDWVQFQKENKFHSWLKFAIKDLSGGIVDERRVSESTIGKFCVGYVSIIEGKAFCCSFLDRLDARCICQSEMARKVLGSCFSIDNHKHVKKTDGSFHDASHCQYMSKITLETVEIYANHLAEEHTMVHHFSLWTVRLWKQSNQLKMSLMSVSSGDFSTFIWEQRSVEVTQNSAFWGHFQFLICESILKYIESMLK